MPSSSDTRARMVETAGALFRRQGYAATGWRTIVEESGTPWGSQHHHFPGGKEQLATEAVRLGGDRSVAALVDALGAHPTVGEAISAYMTLVAAQLVDSDYSAGCPVATVALEMTPGSAALSDVCADSLNGWAAVLEAALGGHGIPGDRAGELATLTVVLIEGALLLSRVRRSPEPLTIAAAEIASLIGREQHRPLVKPDYAANE